MNILIVAASFPYPPASGGALRTYGIINGLSDAGHQVSLLCFGDEAVDIRATPLHRLCQHIEIVSPPQHTKINRLKNLLISSKADIETRFYSHDFKNRLLALIHANEFDITQFEGIEVGCYLPIVKQAATKAKLCFDTFNAEAELQQVIFNIDKQHITQLPKAIYSYLQIGRIRRFEGNLCRLADVVFAVSEEDATILQGYDRAKQIHIIPSGVDVSNYHSTGETLNLHQPALVFTGKMDYRPNTDAISWFARDVLPVIQKPYHLYIVGQKPTPVIRALDAHPNITVTGWVDSVKPYLTKAAIYIAPLRMGSGTRLKLLEAMAAKCAIIATPLAAAGLSSEAKKAMLIAEDETAIINAIHRLLDNADERHSLGPKAHNVVKNHYDWSVILPRLLKIYEDITHAN